jgi:hypothetical protein
MLKKYILNSFFITVINSSVMMAGDVDNETIEASNIHLYPDMTSNIT